MPSSSCAFHPLCEKVLGLPSHQVMLWHQSIDFALRHWLKSWCKLFSRLDTSGELFNLVFFLIFKGGYHSIYKVSEHLGYLR